MGRFIGFPMIADIIADDSKAVTYNNFKFQFYQNKIPKLKVGLGDERSDPQAAEPDAVPARCRMMRLDSLPTGKVARCPPCDMASTCAARCC